MIVTCILSIVKPALDASVRLLVVGSFEHQYRVPTSDDYRRKSRTLIHNFSENVHELNLHKRPIMVMKIKYQDLASEN